jgi:cytochrome c oxidase subunit 2
MLEKLGLMPVQASTVASRVDALYFFLIAVTAFFSLLIAAMIIRFAIKYRRRSDDECPAPIHGSLALELLWTIVPFMIAMVIFTWGASLFITLKRPPNDALQVYAVGRQWMWKLQHLEGRREINELHVPVGRPVRVTLTSEDVIHSFFVPAFRVKQDAVPGRYTTVWFEATKPGTYHLFCAEYCGTQHAGMIGHVVVMEPAAYQDWLGGEQPAGAAGAAGGLSVAVAGQQLFRDLGCQTCHRGDSGAMGPSLAGVPGSTVKLQSGATVTADDDYIRESILTPTAKVVAGYQPVMPTFKGQVNEEQLLQLITYIKSLGGTAAAAPAAGQGS